MARKDPAKSKTSRLPKARPSTTRSTKTRPDAASQKPAKANDVVPSPPKEHVLLPQVEGGSVQVFRHVDPDDFMWTGSGTREIKKSIIFNTRWTAAPHVIVNLVALDASQSQNLRYELLVDAITVDGFDIIFRTWGDTMIASANAQWTAIGVSTQG